MTSTIHLYGIYIAYNSKIYPDEMHDCKNLSNFCSFFQNILPELNFEYMLPGITTSLKEKKWEFKEEKIALMYFQWSKQYTPLRVYKNNILYKNYNIPDKVILCVFYTLTQLYLWYTILTTKNTFDIPVIFYSVSFLLPRKLKAK